MRGWETKTLVIFTLSAGLFALMCLITFFGDGQPGGETRWGVFLVAILSSALAAYFGREILRRQSENIAAEEARFGSAMRAAPDAKARSGDALVESMLPFSLASSSEVVKAAAELVPPEVTDLEIEIEPRLVSSGQWVHRHTIVCTPESPLTAKTSPRLRSAIDALIREMQQHCTPERVRIKGTKGPGADLRVEVERGPTN